MVTEEMLRQRQRPRSRHKVRHSLPKIEPLPGKLYAERKRCNRPICRCVAGGEALHGPYLYRRWMEAGRFRSQYVRPTDANRVRAGIEAWRLLHPPARTARQQLAELGRLFLGLDALGV
jgi:hypothetical protein